MTDTTTTYRRALLTTLLDRVDRGVLLPAEVPLLRALVAAEQAAAEDLMAETRRSLTAEAAITRVRDRCQAVRDRTGPSGMINASQILRLLSPTWPDGNHVAALDGPSPVPDDDEPTRDDAPTAACRVMETRTCPEPCGDRPCARFESNDPAPWQADDVTDWATSPDEQCPAHYTGHRPTVTLDTTPTPVWAPIDWRCERRVHGLGLGEHHAFRYQPGGTFRWPDTIATYPTDAPSDCPSCNHPAHAAGACTERDGAGDHCPCQEPRP